MFEVVQMFGQYWFVMRDGECLGYRRTEAEAWAFVATLGQIVA